MGNVYTVKKVESNFCGQLFPSKQKGDTGTQTKVRALMSMFEDAFLDLGESVFQKGREFEVSFGFVFDEGEEVSYVVSTDVGNWFVGCWKVALEKTINHETTEDMIRCLEIEIDGETFKAYFEDVYTEDIQTGGDGTNSIEMTDEIIHQVERALAEQAQPIARIFHVSPDGE